MTESISCAIPFAPGAFVTMAHGGAGKHARRLFHDVFEPAFGNPALGEEHDGAVGSLEGEGKFAFSTDTHVVRPLFFPGGDIGKLSVCGTVNDLAMCGARPRWLSVGFVLEEGLPIDDLARIVESMRAAAAEAGVSIVTGDTKVVEKGHGDGVYINSSGVGEVVAPEPVNPRRIQPGDAILLSGDIGRHGMAIMAQREGLEFESEIESDCACLVPSVLGLLESSGAGVHCLRDCTRGGAATALLEMAETSGLDFHIEETAVPVTEMVRGACGILGLEPLYVANEGRFLAIAAKDQADQALEALRQHEVSRDAAVIGEVREPSASSNRAGLFLRNAYGLERRLDFLSGEQLPRIC